MPAVLDDLTNEERSWLARLGARKPLYDLPSSVDARLRRLGLAQPVCGWLEISRDGLELLQQDARHGQAVAGRTGGASARTSRPRFGAGDDAARK